MRAARRVRRGCGGSSYARYAGVCAVKSVRGKRGFILAFAPFSAAVRRQRAPPFRCERGRRSDFSVTPPASAPLYHFFRFAYAA